MKLKEICKEIIFTKHAVQQMFSRTIYKNDVIFSIESGDIIKEYKDEKPHPCYLILNIINGKPIHIVLAVDSENKRCVVITVYLPDPNLWDNDFKTKRE